MIIRYKVTVTNRNADNFPQFMDQIIHVLHFFLHNIMNDVINNVNSFPHSYLRNTVKLQIRYTIYQTLQPSYRLKEYLVIKL